MPDPVADKPISTSVGDYLKAIWSVGGTGWASTNELSKRLSVSPASVSSMLARLPKMGFADYEPYHGASLTEHGRREALRLVRRHRLIETFLLEQLGYPLTDLHDEAERLEHAVSDEFTERLAGLLGYPEHDPHGDPIPAPDGTIEQETERSLNESEPGSRVRISRVENRDKLALAYLADRGLVPGELVRVKEVRTLDGVVTIEDQEGVSHALGNSLAGSIFVTFVE
jgi:DtxR family Mn-dependent transcriptional regulator